LAPHALWLTLVVGIKSLFLHKLRSALTILGILIGVTAVIWLVAMGEGVSYQAQEQIKSLGATSIIIKSVKPTEQAAPRTAGSMWVEFGLKWDDFDRLRDTIPAVIEAVPLREASQAARHKDRVLDCQLVGCTPDYLEMNRLVLERGRFIDSRDQRTTDNVCVIASEVAQTLFPYENAIGRSIQIDKDFYVVVGQTATRAPSAAIGGSLAGRVYNLDVYIPLETFRSRIGDLIVTARAGGRSGELVELSQVTLKVRTIDDVDSTAKMAEELLARFHPEKDYSITVPKELLRQAENLRMLFNILLVLIAGISLVVGGIGIMNIMLATVTERTREIGIRRALGAKRSDIVRQFLTETLVLSLTGGILGVACGLFCKPAVRGLIHLARNFTPDLFATLPQPVQNLEPLVAPWSIVVSLLISVLVGIFFGLYPARRAALMDPIEALRHE
jgi:putative ABC transport system permease protein